MSTRRSTLRRNINDFRDLKDPRTSEKSGRPMSWQRFADKCAARCSIGTLRQVVPVVEWLRQYHWRQQMPGDLSAGFVVAVMHVPQGLGYAMLANVAPVAGLYVALAPVLVYAVFGTSRHISIGTFAVTCLMTGQVVSEQSGGAHSAEEVCRAVSLCYGLLLLALWALRLGGVCRVLSETLVSAVTSGAAVHVFTSQLLQVLGLAGKVGPHHGALRLVHTYKDLVRMVPHTNLGALCTALVTIVALVIYHQAVPRGVGRWLPAELVVLVTATATASHVDFGARYGMSVVGPVPAGLPPLQNPVPPWTLLKAVAPGSLGVAAVGFAVTTSMALLLARGEYRVRHNQELLAQGLAALAAATTSAVPPAASLSRSLLQKEAGGSTQLAGVMSSALILAVSLGAGPLFEPLPRAVLAAVIIVALRGMVTAAWRDVSYMVQLGWCEPLVWLLTLLAVVLLDTALGLAAGVLLSLAFAIAKGSTPRTSVLGVIRDSTGAPVYVDLAWYPTAVELPGVRIVRVSCGAALVFPSREALRAQVLAAVGVEPAAVRELQQAAQAAVDPAEQQRLRAQADALAAPQWRVRPGGESSQEHRLTHVVLDLAAVTDCDFSSARSLELLVTAYDSIDVRVLLVFEKRFYSLDSVLSLNEAVLLAQNAQRS